MCPFQIAFLWVYFLDGLFYLAAAPAVNNPFVLPTPSLAICNTGKLCSVCSVSNRELLQLLYFRVGLAQW